MGRFSSLKMDRFDKMSRIDTSTSERIARYCLTFQDLPHPATHYFLPGGGGSPVLFLL